jgi:hypothetical protein
MNHPTHDPVAYFNAINDEKAAVDDALAAIRAEQAEGRLTAVEAATERAGLLERHLERCRQLRAEHFGDPS